MISKLKAVFCFFLIGFSVSTAVSQEPKSKDFFAGAADRNANRFSLLEEKKPPVLPDIVLPFRNNRKHAFEAVEEISTKEELLSLLDELKESYLPYLGDFSPTLPNLREQIPLKDFQWRIQSESDHSDFTGTLHGKGDWEEVKIPHYGGPVGRATSLYYRKFQLSFDQISGKELFICFKGVDYKAHVFVNGAYVGSHEGFFAPFEFNFTPYVKDGENELLVKVENDYTTTGYVNSGHERIFGDKIYGVTGVGFDDFYGGHQCIAGMGIYQDCYIESRQKIFINDVFVRPLFDEQAAEIWLEVSNFKEVRENVAFNISVFGQNFKQDVLTDSLIIPSATHVPGIGDLEKPTDWQQKEVKLGYGTNYFKYRINIPGFRPWSNEHPWLYQAQITVLDHNGKVSDSYAQQFGMRKFQMDTVSTPKGRLYFNNEQIRLRGANTMGFLQQDVFNKNWDQLIDDILLAKACNMNFLRMTQRPVQPEIYDYCDKLGLMLQTDLPTFGGIRYNKWEECVKQAAEMEKLVRNHPSNILITYINERFPNGEGHPHRNMSEPGQYFALFRACNEAVYKENPDRVIKPGDGDYDPPTPGLPDNHCYNTWYNGQGLGIGKLIKGYWQWVKPGWMYGCGEFGAEALDPVKTMYKYYPEEWLPKNKEDEKSWTANRIFAAQTQKFHYMWYNTQYSLSDWVDASQEHQAWALQTVTEAFRRDTNMVTFAAHLFIDAWPAGWMKTIMDVDRNPKKGFFAYREALKPAIVSLRTDRHHYFAGDTTNIEVWICNDLNKVSGDYTLQYQFEHQGKVLKSGSVPAGFPVNSARFQGYLSFETPNVKDRTGYQLRAALIDHKGENVDQALIDIAVFPEASRVIKKKIAVLGENKGVVAYLKQHMDIPEVSKPSDADVILVADFAQYLDNNKDLMNLAASGKRVILFNVPVGKHDIGETEVTIQNTSMGSYYFASPQTGHRFTANSEPFDFRLWYDEKAGYITPFLDKIVLGVQWDPILSSGNTNWVEDHGKAAAVAELKYGKGQFIICQIDLENRIDTNPVANSFIHSLLDDE